MTPRVKICGVTRLADALLAARLGADYLGFNFYQGSPRYVSPERARRIIRRLPPQVKAVGVFVDAPVARVRYIAAHAGLAIAQLHGSESAKQVAQLAGSMAVWKAVRVMKTFRPAELKKYRAADAILLDAYRRGSRGGTGATFDWRAARAANRHARIVLAGGLTPGNVAKAVRVAKPYAVDVASGVESAPGKKDPAKLRAFFRAAKDVTRVLKRASVKG